MTVERVETNKFSWDMPSLFLLSQKAISVCEDPKMTAYSLYRLICIDPVLFSQTLRLYNYFHPNEGKTYNNIAKIIISLNQNTVKNFILRYAKNAEVKRKEIAEFMNIEDVLKEQRRSWLHSHAVGLTSRFFAEERGIKEEDLEEYYAAGLLHDIKKYFAFTINEQNVPEIIGINKSINDVINFHFKRNYQKYSGEFKDMVLNISFSNQFINIENIARSGSTTELKYDPVLARTLGISEAMIAPVRERVVKELEKTLAFVKEGV